MITAAHACAPGGIHWAIIFSNSLIALMCASVAAVLFLGPWMKARRKRRQP